MWRNSSHRDEDGLLAAGAASLKVTEGRHHVEACDASVGTSRSHVCRPEQLQNVGHVRCKQRDGAIALVA